MLPTTLTMSRDLELPHLLDRIGGVATTPAETLGADICDPNTGEPIAAQPASATADVDRAVTLAAAECDWTRTSPDERADALERIADILDADIAKMATADAMTTGVVIATTSLVARIAPAAFRGAATALRSGILAETLGAAEIRRLPRGPAAVIAPWNAPSGIAAHKVASALAAGCPTILKPSEWAPHSCNVIAAAVDAAGLPPGAFGLVHGGAAIGAQLVNDDRIRAVSFTGGLGAGRAVAEACARRLVPCQLELGGNNPLVVLADADLDAAADGIVAGLTTLNGQWCRAVGRIIVHAPHADALLDAVVDRLAAVRLGDSLSIESQMGPLVHAGHLAGVHAALARLQAAGGKAHSATPLPDLPGNFLAPTVVCGVDSADARDEVFGPVATLHPADDDADALRLANDTPFGLAAYVYGGNTDHALAFARDIHAGSVKVGGVSLFSLHPAAPRPAWGLSGLGDEGTVESLTFFCGTRVVGVAP